MHCNQAHLHNKQVGDSLLRRRIGALLVVLELRAMEHPIGLVSHPDDELVAAYRIFERRHDIAIALASLVRRLLVRAQLGGSRLFNHAPIGFVVLHGHDVAMLRVFVSVDGCLPNFKL